MKRSRSFPALALAAIAAAVTAAATASTAAHAQVPTPLAHFGFDIGEDGRLADWNALTSYYDRVAAASPRVTLDTLGTTTQGRPFVMLTITSPANHGRLAELQEIQTRLADPRRIRDEHELEDLFERGRAVVLITNHIHSSEVGSGQMPARLIHRLATADETRIVDILDNVILLYIPSLNPDGTQMVAEWWRRWAGTEHEGAPLPWLYHHYIGHNNNRDWYAFTQVETQLTVGKAHNVWRPHIVHDIHQMGPTAARFFVPPFIEPWEPNVDPGIVAAVNQLGAYIAAEMTAAGKSGVVVNAIFDAYTPARAYQHYHGGARILSETASALWASPIDVDPDRLDQGRGYNAGERSWNFPDPWPGGTWRLGDIVDYMEAGAAALLTNAARNRRYWLENFHAINRRAVDRWPSWPHAWVLPADQPGPGLDAVIRILRLGDVEVLRALRGFDAAGRRFPAGTYVVPMNQPYASFAQTLLERQDYPDLRLYPGGPPLRPYDVTAHTLPLLMNVEAVPVDEPLDAALSPELIAAPALRYQAPAHLVGPDAPRIAVFRSWQEPMTQGWTRWLFDRHDIPYAEVGNAEVRGGGLSDRYDVIVFQDQTPQSIRDGWPADRMPAEFAGGLGSAGADALREFVRAGGRIVAVEQAADYMIDIFDLPISNAVDGLDDEAFFIPGSILRLDVESDRAVTRGVGPSSIAWFWRTSRAFDAAEGAARVLARYGHDDTVLAGWVLGVEHVAGKPALLEANLGAGSLVLFGFQPNYRGQSIATWPLFFNALGGDEGRAVD